ncbi:MAG: putative prolin-rich exported protein [Acidobacteria bacterium]|nr:putative prolin-rich exported protein [Acidobacteriota bacterium]
MKRPLAVLRAALARMLVVAVLAAAALPALAQEDLPGRAGRLADVAGRVYLATEERAEDWVEALRNYTVTSGDNLWVAGDGRAEIDYGGGQVRLAGDTNVHVARLDDRVLALFVAQGRVIVRLRVLEPGESARIDTPNTQIALTRPGLYRVEVAQDRTRTDLVVREGEALAQLASGAQQQVLPGQSATLVGPEPGQAEVRTGYWVDGFDTWSAERDRRYERSRSTSYVSPQMVGYADLDEFGRWETVPEYGAVWYPTTVAVGWAPAGVGVPAASSRARCGRRRWWRGTAAAGGRSRPRSARRSTAGCRSAGASRTCRGGAAARTAAGRCTTGPTRSASPNATIPGARPQTAAVPPPASHFYRTKPMQASPDAGRAVPPGQATRQAPARGDAVPGAGRPSAAPTAVKPAVAPDRSAGQAPLWQAPSARPPQQPSSRSPQAGTYSRDASGVPSTPVPRGAAAAPGRTETRAPQATPVPRYEPRAAPPSSGGPSPRMGPASPPQTSAPPASRAAPPASPAPVPRSVSPPPSAPVQRAAPPASSAPVQHAAPAPPAAPQQGAGPPPQRSSGGDKPAPRGEGQKPGERP